MKTREEIANFELEILELLRNVMDPEIEINIVDLGLIYEIHFNGEDKIDVVMTFSTPSCPLGDTIVSNIKEVIRKKYPELSTEVEVVFEPQWSTALVSEEGKEILGM